MDAKFKGEVLKFRYGFADWEKKNFPQRKISGTQEERRAFYKSYMEREGASKEIIEYSMNEFLPLTKEQ